MKAKPFLLISCLVLSSAAGQQRDPQEYIKRLERPERVERLQVSRVIRTLNLSSGQKVADLGAGSGLFTVPLAKAVGEGGMVYAVDIDSALLRHIEGKVREENAGSVRTVLASENDPRIPEPVDLVFLCDTLHHISDRGAYLKTLRRYLKPSGRITVIDFSKDWPSSHEDMRYSVQELEQWMTAASFRIIETHTFLDNNFFVIYQMEERLGRTPVLVAQN